jgi:hypothetical protein
MTLPPDIQEKAAPSGRECHSTSGSLDSTLGSGRGASRFFRKINMTNELEKLRAEVAELRAKLASQFEDPRKAAFIRAGCSESSADDAVRCARISGNRGANLWKVNDVPVESLDAAVAEFLEAHAWFRTNHTAPEPEPEDTRPRYADETLVPVEKMSDDELWRAAGPAPEAEPQKPSEPQPGESLIDADFRAAGPMPKPDDDDAEALKRWNADLDRQAAYREEVHRERVKALKEAGARIDEPVREWVKP